MTEPMTNPMRLRQPQLHLVPFQELLFCNFRALFYGVLVVRAAVENNETGIAPT
jgi:hypothetical protein